MIRRSAIPRVSKKREAREGKLYSTLAKPKKPIKPRNAKRSKKNFERAYGGKAYRDFVVSLPCIIADQHECAGPMDPSHVKGGGVGYKGDAEWLVPKCRKAHDEYHDHGRATFEAKYGVDVKALAQMTRAQWAFECARRSGAAALSVSETLTGE